MLEKGKVPCSVEVAVLCKLPSSGVMARVEAAEHGVCCLVCDLVMWLTQLASWKTNIV